VPGWSPRNVYPPLKSDGVFAITAPEDVSCTSAFITGLFWVSVTRPWI
jgi:hypothetical protein